MSKSLFASLAATLALALVLSGQNAPKKSALNKATLEAYVRHLYVMDSRITVQGLRPQTFPESPRLSGRQRCTPPWERSRRTFEFHGVQGWLAGSCRDTVFDIATTRSSRNWTNSRLTSSRAWAPPAHRGDGGVQRFRVPVLQRRGQACCAQNLLSAYPKQVRLYFRISRSKPCTRGPRPAAIAAAASCGRMPPRSGTIHDWIFGNQTTLPWTTSRTR